MKYDPDVFASIFTTLGLATGFIVLRLVARRITRVRLWWDDYMAILAFITALAWSVVVLYWTIVAGLGRPLSDVDMPEEDALLISRLLLYLGEIFYASSLAFSKFSILGFYWRLFSSSSIRLPIQILVVCSAIWLIIRTFMAIFHCIPVQAFWIKGIPGARCDIEDSKFFFGTVLVHLFIDIAILALPVVQVKHLQLKTGQKIGVTGLFMFGIFVCIASIVVLVESLKFNSATREMPLEITSIMVWATVEVNLAIVSSCLPMMRPVLRKILPGGALSSNKASHSASHGPRSGAIKLSTISGSKEVDESSSQHQLADAESGSVKSDEYERYYGNSGHKTVVSCMADDARSARGDGDMGIHVRNETTIRVEDAQ